MSSPILSQFRSDTGTPIAPGYVYGLRSFAPNSGRKGSIALSGVSYDDFMWQDGTNVAECKGLEHGADITADNHMAKHSCGFWAYYGLEDPYRDNSRISGVVESSGIVVLGEKGFRAEKSKIVALAYPKSIKSARRFALVALTLFILMSIVSVLTVASIIDSGGSWFYALFPLVIVAPGIPLGVKAATVIKSGKMDQEARLSSLSAAYPSAKVYDSYDDMVAEWKGRIAISKPEPPQGEGTQ